MTVFKSGERPDLSAPDDKCITLNGTSGDSFSVPYLGVATFMRNATSITSHSFSAASYCQDLETYTPTKNAKESQAWTSTSGHALLSQSTENAFAFRKERSKYDLPLNLFLSALFLLYLVEHRRIHHLHHEKFHRVLIQYIRYKFKPVGFESTGDCSVAEILELRILSSDFLV